MKILVKIFILLFAFSTQASRDYEKLIGQHQKIEDAPEVLFDNSKFQKSQYINVYVNPKTGYTSVLNFIGFDEKKIPLLKRYFGSNYCYLFCLSNDPKLAYITLNNGKNIVGAIKVKGGYSDNICFPYGIYQLDYSTNTHLQRLCSMINSTKCPEKGCYISGDTARFFGQ